MEGISLRKTRSEHHEKYFFCEERDHYSETSEPSISHLDDLSRVNLATLPNNIRECLIRFHSAGPFNGIEVTDNGSAG